MSADSVGLPETYANCMYRDKTSRWVKVSEASAYEKPPRWILKYIE